MRPRGIDAATGTDDPDGGRVEYDERATSRQAALAILRWVLGGAPIDEAQFLLGFAALPRNLRPLAADQALRNLAGLDSEERAPLAWVFRHAAIGSMARTATVRGLRETLDQAAIPQVFLKGIALAAQVYPRPATRPSLDIDVWIRPDDLQGAVGALSRAGFAIPPRFSEPSEPRGPTPMTYLEKRVAGVPVLVDLHVRPTSLRELTDEEVRGLWESRIPLGPSELPVLPLDRQLLHVCLHLARSHGFVAGLKVLVDIAMIARTWPDEQSWGAFCAHVFEVRAARPVFVCLELARELLGARIPEAVLEELGAGTEQRVVDQARRLIWCRDPDLPLGTVKLLGGGLPEPGWLRNRIRLRRHISREERQRMQWNELPPLRLFARFIGRRLWSASRLILGGEAFTAQFWDRVDVERNRTRLLHELRIGGTPSQSIDA